VTSVATTSAGPPNLPPKALWRVVAVLSVTEITSWGVLYYAFPVLAPAISADTGWSMTRLTAAFSASLLTAAVLGVAVGAAVDRFGPRPVMGTGSLLAVPAVVGLSQAPTYPLFVGAWIVAGAATSALLYPPAFAALTHWGGTHRVRALTTLTLVAGFSSTLFAPLTALLEASLGWRKTYLVLAVVLLVVTVPGHWVGLRQPWVPAQHPSRSRKDGQPTVWRTRPFLLLIVVMTAAALCVYATVINLVPLLMERGLSTGEAAVALGLGGVGQVVGRIGYAWLVGHTSVSLRSGLVVGTVALSTALLALLPGAESLLVALSMLAGVARGMFTLVQATAVSDRWGTARFGRVNGILLAPVMVATAAAPWAGSALAQQLGSYAVAFVVLAGSAVLAAALTPWATPEAPSGER
jgi:MFS family permease